MNHIFLEELQRQHLKFSEDWKELDEYYGANLWHQLTLKLERCIERPAMRDNHRLLLELYNGFIYTVFDKLSPWSLATMAVSVAKNLEDSKQAGAVLFFL